MRTWTVVVTLLFVRTCLSHPVDAAPDEVEPALSVVTLADPARWWIVGCEVFKSNELCAELATDSEIVAASRSTVTVDELIEVVTRRMRLGYLHSGFHDATVTAKVDPSTRHLVINVHEGKRSLRGKVEVRGATRIDVERLAKAVTESDAPDGAIPVYSALDLVSDVPLGWVKAGQTATLNSPVWTVGKPASFDPTTWKRMDKRVRLILERQWFVAPVVATSVVPAEDGTATLIITVDKEGPRTVLDEIEVIGNERNSTEDILDYLLLKQGMPFDVAQLERVCGRLRQSARFLKSDVELFPPLFTDTTWKLRVTLVEAPGVPLLKEPLTEIQQIAVRAAGWMSTQTEFDWEITSRDKLSDLIGTISGNENIAKGTVNTRYIGSTRNRAMVLTISVDDSNGKEAWSQVLSLSADQACLLSPHRKEKLDWGRFEQTVTMDITLDVMPPDERGRTSSFKRSLGWSTSKLGGHSFMTNVAVHPLALLKLVIDENNRVELADGMLTVRGTVHGKGETIEVVIDTTTGRLVRLRYDDRDNESFDEIRTGASLYADAARRWQPDLATAANQLRMEAPLTSILKYAASEVCVIEQSAAKVPPPWFLTTQRILAADVLKPLDDAVVQSRQNSFADSTFSIPVDFKSDFSDGFGFASGVGFELLHWLPCYAQLFPYGTPGWTIGREALLVLEQRMSVSIPTPYGLIEMLEDSSAGPLHYLAAAKVLDYVSPGYRAILARRGLKGLSADSLCREIKSLIDDNGAASKIVVNFAQFLRGLDEPGRKDFAEMFHLTPEERTIFMNKLDELARRADVPTTSLLPELAEHAWLVIHPRIEAALK